MYDTRGEAFDGHLRTFLADLCFLDEREQDCDGVREVLRRYGKLGVVGPFVVLIGKDSHYIDEVASVWAEQLHRLGYLQVGRLLDTQEWGRLMAALKDRFDGKDVRRSEVQNYFGPPSIVAGRRVLCYAPDDGSGWVFFDCYTESSVRYVAGAGHYTGERDDDPLVRSVRHPAPDFESGLILTLYGKVLRWGPGWWLEHASSDLTDEKRAIAAQLRDIEAADPSQALKPPRGHLAMPVTARWGG